jgi:16S rRNA (cytidine1402-2'-O)-methyltransferase
VDRLRAGESIALVSDAGTPLVSDPGRELVTLAREEGIRVEAIPGPSAVMAAISSSGLATTGFAFHGFVPVRSKARIEAFSRLGLLGHTTIFFEAPHRIVGALTDLATVVGNEFVIGVGRELTKAHEELVVAPISRLLAHFDNPRGEFTLIIPAPPSPATDAPLPDSAELAAELVHLTKDGESSRRDALRTLATRYGTSVNELYKLLKPTD